MAMDYKSSSARRNDAASGNSTARPMNPMFLGIIIGMLLGIIIALVVALWLNKSAIPFMERTKALEPPPKLENKAAPKTDTPPAAAEVSKSRAGSDKPRFEFYQILPGEKEASGKDAKPAAKKAPMPAPAQPGKTPDKPPREIYYLQAGAFQNVTDADNLKAQIAFIGLQASVSAVTVPDKGTLHRVRLGPYQSLEEVNRIKEALSQNGVGSAVVKTSDAVN
jgi:cell division protein FtsN